MRGVKTRMWKFVTGMVSSIRFTGAVRILFVGALDCVFAPVSRNQKLVYRLLLVVFDVCDRSKLLQTPSTFWVFPGASQGYASGEIEQ